MESGATPGTGMEQLPLNHLCVFILFIKLGLCWVRGSGEAAALLR